MARDLSNALPRLWQWLGECVRLLPLLTMPTPRQVLTRLVLVLAASLLMLVILTSIDCALLYVYVGTQL